MTEGKLNPILESAAAIARPGDMAVIEWSEYKRRGPRSGDWKIIGYELVYVASVSVDGVVTSVRRAPRGIEEPVDFTRCKIFVVPEVGRRAAIELSSERVHFDTREDVTLAIKARI